MTPQRTPRERFRNYCGLITFATSGFPWEKTTTGDVAPPDFLRAARAEGNDVQLSPRKAACSLWARTAVASSHIVLRQSLPEILTWNDPRFASSGQPPVPRRALNLYFFRHNFVGPIDHADL
jgi:hypothetical protein